MIYVLYDKPRSMEDMSFLTAKFESPHEEIYPPCRCLSIKQMIAVCWDVVNRTGEGDMIVCWYDFMGVLCWWLAKLKNKKGKILAINLLLKDKRTLKNRIAKFLYRSPLQSSSFATTVTAREYGQYINEILKIQGSYYLLPDVYHAQYRLDEKVETEEQSVFCGGRNGRDWDMLFRIARMLPEVTFHCVMPGSLQKQHGSALKSNISICTDLPEKEFLRQLCRAKLLVMPLNTQAPAGLTVYFQAAANNKMVITSSTVTTREYFAQGRGVLCTQDPNEWKEKIQHYLSHPQQADAYATEFKGYLENVCSEEAYAQTLWDIVKAEDTI